MVCPKKKGLEIENGQRYRKDFAFIGYIHGKQTIKHGNCKPIDIINISDAAVVHSNITKPFHSLGMLMMYLIENLDLKL